MKVLISCGGTGGHINPGLAIADIIKSKYPDTEFLFAGTPGGMEAKLVPQAGYKLETIKVAGFQRRISLENVGRNIKALAYLATSGHRAKEIIENFKPDIAIGTGGYAAGPVIRKAARMGIPTAIHEQNALSSTDIIRLSTCFALYPLNAVLSRLYRLHWLLILHLIRIISRVSCR
jgi:UDP-N-acetylglucosamine--N-acetylmuramyl-(pentapeptide) pyrophosphoryl-undecaprenol N-acetylglucosamine transferase